MRCERLVALRAHASRLTARRVRAVGKGDSYIRLTPNPGFSLRFPLCPRLTWSIHKGWRLQSQVSGLGSRVGSGLGTRDSGLEPPYSGLP